MPKKQIGKIAHYYPNIGVAVVKLTGALKVGDKISIDNNGEEFEQEVKSMQVEHKQIKEAKAKQDIGLKLEKPTKENAIVYKL